MIFLEIGTVVICGALFAWGGYSFLVARRYIMPVVIGASMAIITHLWWVLILPLPVMSTLCLGYFPWGAFGRGAWLALQAIVIGIGVVLLGHLAWYFYVPYVILAFLAGAFLFKIQQIIGDCIFGVILALPVFFIH